MNHQKLIQLLGIKSRELSELTGAPQGSCTHWKQGSRPIPERYRAKVSELIRERYNQAKELIGDGN